MVEEKILQIQKYRHLNGHQEFYDMHSLWGGTFFLDCAMNTSLFAINNSQELFNQFADCQKSVLEICLSSDGTPNEINRVIGDEKLELVSVFKNELLRINELAQNAVNDTLHMYKAVINDVYTTAIGLDKPEPGVYVPSEKIDLILFSDFQKSR